MGKRRLARCLLCLVFLIALIPGCQVLYRYRPVPVLVRDAETKKPIADANVHLYYPLSRDSLAPYNSTEHSDGEGVAHLRAAPYGDFGVRVEATAAGYLPDQVSLSTESIQHVEPVHLFEDSQRRKPEFVVEMYHEPHFTVELVVPRSYRGLIKAEIEEQDDTDVPPGQRCFRFQVVDGFVRVKGPGIVLRRVYPSDYHARYDDDTPLSSEMSLQKVGFRWLRGKDKVQYFVVGTQPEYDMQRRYAPDDEPVTGQRTAVNTSNQGRGGRHRRNN
ncbi:MAG TPA: hypothetical protein VH592_12235 [Gemmataceae bacterium]